MTENVSTAERLIPILDSFSERFHQNLRGKHRLASPLGAWCLLAYIAINDDNPHPKVIESLGCSPEEAQEILTKLLKKQPKVVSLAVKAWLNPSAANVASVKSWDNEAKEVASPIKDIPTQDELNAWARAESNRLITQFPVEINPDMFLALFTNLVGTEVAWESPYKAVSDEAMGSAWKIDNFLVAHKETYSSYIYQDETYDLFGVHRKFAKDGEFSVYSVIALDNNVSEEATMAVARKIVSSGGYKRFSAHELPLGESANGTLSVTAQKAPSSEEIFTTFLPAWESSNNFNLLQTDLGFREAIERFEDMDDAGIYVEAKQGVEAQYTAEGFKASSRTFGIATKRCRPVEDCEIRHVTMRFNRPYAVVAMVDDVNKTWNRVPIFDGWVAEASEIKINRRS
jgi:hypothetical protein